MKTGFTCWIYWFFYNKGREISIQGIPFIYATLFLVTTPFSSLLLPFILTHHLLLLLLCILKPHLEKAVQFWPPNYKKLNYWKGCSVAPRKLYHHWGHNPKWNVWNGSASFHWSGGDWEETLYWSSNALTSLTISITPSYSNLKLARKLEIMVS